jgi:hypothetical protein
MTLTLTITLIVLLDLALVAGAAFVMSHAAKLTPHQPGVTGNHWRLRRPLRSHQQSRPHGERGPARLSPALDS